MSRKHIPYFSFYPADFMNGVRGLSAQDVGVYTMLLCQIYEENGPVELNHFRLATYCGMRVPAFTKSVEKLIALGKLELENGHLKNKRAEAEIQKRADGLKINSKAGLASAQKRQQKQAAFSTTVQRPFNQAEADTDTDKDNTPSGVVSSAPPEKLDLIQAKLIEAIGEGNIQPHGALNLSAVLGLISAGVDLETDILPTIKAKAQRLTRPVGSWSYFTDAIRDAHNRRVQAGLGIVKPSTPEADDKRWAGRLKLARDRKYWSTPEWGPMPGLEGCIVPKRLLAAGDGNGWQEYKVAA
jgi:uncharacterized protein YdaU (DUF1376 family)